MYQTFKAQAFHPELGNEVVNGQIVFVGQALRFQSAGDSLEIPLERLVAEVAEGDDRIFFTDPWQPELNAQALPGGHIIVNTGLMKLTDRPEELLGVIAHEVAHVTRKHHFRKEIASGGPLLICQMFIRGRSGGMGALAGISALMVGQGFSQEYEVEADDVGWAYLVKANIEPRGMTEMFRKLRAYESMQKALKVPQAFSSHPALEKRIRRLETKWNKLPRKTGFLDFKDNPQRQP